MIAAQLHELIQTPTTARDIEKIESQIASKSQREKIEDLITQAYASLGIQKIQTRKGKLEKEPNCLVKVWRIFTHAIKKLLLFVSSFFCCCKKKVASDPKVRELKAPFAQDQSDFFKHLFFSLWTNLSSQKGKKSIKDLIANSLVNGIQKNAKEIEDSFTSLGEEREGNLKVLRMALQMQAIRNRRCQLAGALIRSSQNTDSFIIASAVEKNVVFYCCRIEKGEVQVQKIDPLLWEDEKKILHYRIAFGPKEG